MVYLLISFLFLQSSWAQSECGQPLLILRTPSEIVMGLTAPKTPPFQKSCGETKEQIKKIKSNSENYELGLFSGIPRETKTGRSTKRFFLELYKKIQKRIALEKEKAVEMKACSMRTRNPSCVQLHPDTIEAFDNAPGFNILDLTVSVRHQLMVAHPTGLWGQLLDPKVLNTTLLGFGIYKDKKWDRRTLAEEKVAQKHLEEIFANNGNDPERIKEVRKLCYDEYAKHLSLNPILQFMKSSSPNMNELIKAQEAMIQSLIQEKARVDKASASLETGENLQSNIISLLNYRNEVNEVLKDHPEFCGIANALFHLKRARDISTEAVINGTVVAASYIGTAPLGAALVVVGSAALIKSREDDVQSARSQLLGRTSGELEEISTAQRAEQVQGETPKSYELNQVSGKIMDRNLDIIFLGTEGAAARTIGRTLNKVIRAPKP